MKKKKENDAGTKSPGTRGATTHRLNLHDTYQVNWTPEMVARDLVQNYYDSVAPADFAQSITIDADSRAGRLRIAGPTPFNLELLWRLGVGTKGEDAASGSRYAGGFGEGFLVAVLQILRGRDDAGVTVSSGHSRAVFRYEPITVAGRPARELVCDSSTAAHVDGSELLITNCPPALLKAAAAARDCFFYPGHPLLGEELTADSPRWYETLNGLACRRPDCDRCRTKREAAVSAAAALDADHEPTLRVYRSTGPAGAVFYRRQLRARFDLPYVFCCHRTIEKINPGRDRLNLTKKESSQVISKALSSLTPEAIHELVMRDLRPHWAAGHPLLAALVDALDPCYSGPSPAFDFPPEYCAASYDIDGRREAVRQGVTVCAGYLRRFGMKSASETARANSTGTFRSPLPFATHGRAGHPTAGPLVNEVEAFDILRSAYLATARPGSQGAYDLVTSSRKLSVFDAAEAAVNTRGLHNPKRISLERRELRAPFHSAFATFTHEAEHDNGPDGSYPFARALKHCLASVIDNRELLADPRTRWEQNVRRGAPAPPATTTAIMEAIEPFSTSYAPHHEGLALALCSEHLAQAYGTDVFSFPFTLDPALTRTLPAEERRPLYRLLLLTSEQLGRAGGEESRLGDNLDQQRVALLSYARSLDPLAREAYLELFFLYLYHLDDARKARATIREGLRRLPDCHELHAALGELEHERGTASRAAAAYRKAQTFAPADVTYAGELSRVYRFNDDLTNAYAALDEGVAHAQRMISEARARNDDRPAGASAPPAHDDPIRATREHVITHPAFRRHVQLTGSSLRGTGADRARYDEIVIYYFLDGNLWEAEIELDMLATELKKEVGEPAFARGLRESWTRAATIFDFETLGHEAIYAATQDFASDCDLTDFLLIQVPDPPRRAKR